ncbi:MAG: hypothetical protein OEV73_00025 [Desulfobulbaceae bacterium]|nr:hypothetical protein [Desulfobulbaceae bacterium]
MRWLLLVLALLSGCGQATDAELITKIVADTGYYSKKADAEWDAAMASASGVKDVSMMPVAATAIGDHNKQLDAAVVWIARPYTRTATEIANADARKHVLQGINCIHNAQAARREFLTDLQTAMASGDPAAVAAVAGKHQGSLGACQSLMLVGLGHFADAKKIAGMPLTMDEFK